MGYRNVRAWGLLLAASMISASLAWSQAEKKITVESAAFKQGEAIPLKYSAYGDNQSPPLNWKDLPEGTKQLALICDDPDAPMPQPFVHWVIYNIPADAKGLPEALAADEVIEEPASVAGAIHGRNGIGQTRYFGPRPPADGKVHHYHFKLFAIDADLDLKPGLNKTQLLEAIEGHVIGRGELIGTYENKG